MVSDMGAMTVEEFMHWLAYFKLREKADSYNKGQN